jgi:hypothetical protein
MCNNGVCRANCTAGGTCNTNPNRNCFDGRVTCAANGSPGCADNTSRPRCGSSQVCSGGSCASCGGNGQPCCSGTPCEVNLECNSGRCGAACGDRNEPCCEGHTCNGNALTCVFDLNGGPSEVIGTCGECGALGDPCCAGDRCPAEPPPGLKLACVRALDPKCYECGAENLFCCSSNSGHQPCDPGLACKISPFNDLPGCFPDPCGRLGQRCCAGRNELECSEGQCNFRRIPDVCE